MFRVVCALIFVGLFTGVGCEKKTAEQPPKKVTGEDVRRDAGRTIKTATEYSRQATERFEKKLGKELAEQPPVKVAPAKVASKEVQPDAGQALKLVPERLQPVKEDMPKKFEPRHIGRVSVQAGPETPRVDAAQVANSKQMKAEFQKKLEAKLDEMDGKIIMLRAKGNNLKGADKTNWDQKMAELDVKRDTARAKLNKVVGSSVEGWNDVKREAESAWDDLNQTFLAAEKAFPN